MYSIVEKKNASCKAFYLHNQQLIIIHVYNEKFCIQLLEKKMHLISHFIFTGIYLSDVCEPKTFEPEKSESSEPKTSEPKTSEPKIFEPKTSEPKKSKPNTSEPNKSGPPQATTPSHQSNPAPSLVQS